MSAKNWTQASHMPGKCTTTEPQSQSQPLQFFLYMENAQFTAFRIQPTQIL